MGGDGVVAAGKKKSKVFHEASCGPACPRDEGPTPPAWTGEGRSPAGSPSERRRGWCCLGIRWRGRQAGTLRGASSSWGPAGPLG